MGLATAFVEVSACCHINAFRTITEVKQRRTWSIRVRVTAWEYEVQYAWMCGGCNGSE